MKKQSQNSIKRIESSRTGGQIAMMGYSYQLLYSLYLTLLHVKNENYVRFEGIEDIDSYLVEENKEGTIYHTQLKYSTNKQDASFMKSVLKNFVEIYLLDKDNEVRFFKLVYNFDVAKGNLEKLIQNNLDKENVEYWEKIIDTIKFENLNWDWNNFDFNKFIKQLKFEKVDKAYLENEIEKLIIKRFEIHTSNINLFFNGLFYTIFQAAKEREKINDNLLNTVIQNIKEDIHFGEKNPAVHWISKIDFKKTSPNYSSNFFEGKRVTINDIVENIPIRRLDLENQVRQSIFNNTITVIKSSSGQGKSTLALQAMFNLSKDMTVYRIDWCKHSKEIKHLVQYFKNRISVGEHVLILIDNLNEDHAEWNKLAFKLKEDISINYKIVITVREEDWNQYAGDQSQIGSLNLIKPELTPYEAKEIYYQLKLKGKIHPNTKNWQIEWEKIDKSRLLIEYIYLVTQGHMIRERLENQLNNLSKMSDYYLKIEILKIVTLADVFGIKIKTEKLTEFLCNAFGILDINFTFKSLENEYYLKFENDTEYIEGLHQVRSQHIVNILFENTPYSNTLISLIQIVDDFYITKLCSYLPSYLSSELKEEFYENLANKAALKSYIFMTNIIKGLFSGSTLQYYIENKFAFDEANAKGVLFFFITGLFPIPDKTMQKSLEDIFDTLKRNDKFSEGVIKFESTLKSVPRLELPSTDAYIFSYYLNENLYNKQLKRIKTSFSDLSYWLYRIDKNFNLTCNLDIEQIWTQRDSWSFHDLSKLMFLYSKTSIQKFNEFISINKDEIFSYLIIQTDSLELNEVNNNIIIKYLLLPFDQQNSNNLSVNRIEDICRFLPIYETYITETIKLEIDILNQYEYHDNSSKKIPYENVILKFNTDMTSIWLNTLQGMYKADSIYQWQEHYIKLRKIILDLIEICISFITKKIKGKKLGQQEINEFVKLKQSFESQTLRKMIFPSTDFNSKHDNSSNDYKISENYYHDFQIFLNAFIDLLTLKDISPKLVLINLKYSITQLSTMHQKFKLICSNTYSYFDLEELYTLEINAFNKMYTYIDYFINNRHFNKKFSNYEIELWKRNQKNLLLNSIKEIIQSINIDHSITVLPPKDIFQEDIFNVLPICMYINEFNSMNFLDIITSLNQFKNVDISFINITFIDSNKKILPNSFRVAIDKINDIAENKSMTFNPFLPIPINLEILNLLDLDSINIIKQDNNINDDLLSILYQLWTYSVISSYTIKVNDSNELYFLNTKLIAIKNNIETALFNSNFSREYKDFITEILGSVLDNKLTIDNTIINNFVNHIISETIEELN